MIESIYRVRFPGDFGMGVSRASSTKSSYTKRTASTKLLRACTIPIATTSSNRTWTMTSIRRISLTVLWMLMIMPVNVS